ncbi:MAG: hypothetical protein OFPII_43310 [Osedax symbiont Rs1]|nr:MAG: hypothetical protein OFPII_43310 [Osedax symbiont Rs1]
MDSLTISSSLLVPTGEKRLTPAMVTALWVIGDELDTRRIPVNIQDAMWLNIPSKRLRGSEGRNDNVWLRECLERLTGLKINGTYKNEPWGAVVIAEWHITQGGAVTRILIPPAAIRAIRAPETFAKIEAFAAYKLQGASRRLYAVLADKKRMAKPYWAFSVDELRQIMGVQEKKSYKRWNNFRQWVLEPAIEQINDFGTVTVKMTPQRVGRSVSTVRFDWVWKTIDQARKTEDENNRPTNERGKEQLTEDAPPLINIPNVTSPIVLELKRNISPDTWISWFGKCNFIDEVSGGIRIIAPTDFIADHIRQNFPQEIANAKRVCNIKGAVMVISKK